ncbi:gntP permease family protein [Escherichia coli BCE032_MS-12]|nr:gntP permease family protein [Escherichia coli BCE019_MS-13]ENB33435.1 gntP permease family protein [Escherichia coli BCE032_MS-12]
MLLLLVIKAKAQPFVALLLVSLLVALAAGIPAGEVGKVMIAGMGGVLGSVTIIIGLGAAGAYDRTLWWCRVTG